MANPNLDSRPPPTPLTLGEVLDVGVVFPEAPGFSAPFVDTDVAFSADEEGEATWPRAGDAFLTFGGDGLPLAGEVVVFAGDLS